MKQKTAVVSTIVCIGLVVCVFAYSRYTEQRENYRVQAFGVTAKIRLASAVITIPGTNELVGLVGYQGETHDATDVTLAEPIIPVFTPLVRGKFPPRADVLARMTLEKGVKRSEYIVLFYDKGDALVMRSHVLLNAKHPTDIQLAIRPSEAGEEYRVYLSYKDAGVVKEVYLPVVDGHFIAE